MPILSRLRRGATLIDMVVATGIVVVIASVAISTIPVRRGYILPTDRKRDDGAKNIQRAVEQYFRDHRSFPFGTAAPVTASAAMEICADGMTVNPRCMHFGNALRGTYYAATPRDQTEPCQEFTGFRIFQPANSLAPQVIAVHKGKLPGDQIAANLNCGYRGTRNIQVTVEGMDVENIFSTVNFGRSSPGSPVRKTFTVTNVGTSLSEQITLQEPISVPPGFSVIQSFGKTTLAASGDSTTFILQLNADAPENVSGTVSFGNNDPVKNPFRFTVAGNGTLSSSSSSAASSSSAPASVADIELYAPDGRLIPYNGFYDMGKAKIPEPPIRRTFRVRNAGTSNLTLTSLGDPSSSIPLNCQLGADFGELVLVPGQETTFQIWKATAGDPDTRYCDGIVRFSAAGDPDENPFRFSIRAEVVPTNSQEVQVTEGNTDIVSGVTVTDFGSTPVGQGVVKTFTVRNVGTDPLRLTGNPVMPAGFTLLTDFGAVPRTLNAWQSADIRVQYDATSLGTAAGDITFTTDDPDEGVFRIPVRGTGTRWPGPEIQVLDGSLDIPRGGAVDFGSTTVGTPVTRPIRVKNIGSETLTLTPPITVPAGFSVVQSFVQETLAPDAETTFTLRLTAGAEGTYGGRISFANNDSNENPFTFNVSGTVTAMPLPEIQLWSNGAEVIHQSGVVEFGSTVVNTPVTRTIEVRNVGTGPLGLGMVSMPAGFTATQPSPSVVAPGSFATFTVTMAAASAGVKLGTGGLLNTDSDENPFSFTLRGQVTAAPEPEILVRYGTAELTNGVSRQDFGSTVPGVAVARTYTVINVGTANLDITSIVAPGEFWVSQPGLSRLMPGQSTTFTVTMPAIHIGVFSGPVVLSSTDGDENPFTFTLAGIVAPGPLPNIQVLLDGVDVGTDSGWFATTQVGVPVRRSFVIRNAGSAPLTLGGPVEVWADPLRSQATTGFTVAIQPSRTVLQPGEEVSFTMQMNAAAASSPVAQVFVDSNDPYEETRMFLVQGAVISGSVPEIEVRRMSEGLPLVQDGMEVVDLGTTVVGTPVTVRFQVANRGTRSLDVGPLVTAPSGFTVSVPLTITSIPAFSPTVTSEFAVRLTAASAGTYEGDVSFPNSDSDEDPFNFRVRGRVAAAPQPEIEVRLEDGTVVADGGGTVAFGATPSGFPVERTFTIANAGNATLTVGTVSLVHASDPSQPSGFSMMQQPVQSIAPGGTAVFKVRLDATVAGSKNATLQFSNNDSNENPYNFPLSGTVNPAVPQIQLYHADGMPCMKNTCVVDFGATTVGNPVNVNLTVKNIGTAALNLISLSVPAGGFTVTQAPPSSLQGGQAAPITLRMTAASAGFPEVSASITSTDGNNSPYGFQLRGSVLAADAPYARVWESGTEIADGGTYGFGSTAQGSAIIKTFTVQNAGTSTLTLSPAQVTGADFALNEGFLVSALAPGAETTFRVRMPAATAGAQSGQVSFGTNEGGARNPFNFQLTGTVTAPPAAPRIELYIGNSGPCPKTTCVVDFGTRPLSSPATLTMTVRNAGTANLTGLAVNGVGGNFSVAPGLGTTVLAPGASTTFGLRYDAAVLGTVTRNVSVASSDSANNPFAFQLRGMAEQPALAEIEVWNLSAGTVIPANGTVDFGSIVTGAGQTLAQTFRIKNIGVADLQVPASAGLFSAFTVVSDIQDTLLSPGEATDFTLRTASQTVGTHAEGISLQNNDADENPFRFTVRYTVQAQAAPDIAVWDGGLEGVRVEDEGTVDYGAITAGASSSRTKTYTVMNTGTANLTVSSITAPAVGAGFTLTSTLTNAVIAPGRTATFSVRLDGTSAGAKSASVTVNSNAPPAKDAYRINVAGQVNATALPEIQVLDGNGAGPDLPLGSAVDFGSTLVGTPVSRAFTVVNAGGGTLTLGAITAPAGFSVQTGFSSTSLTAGQTATFTLRLDAQASQVTPPFQGTLSFVNGDGNENPFTLTLRGTVHPECRAGLPLVTDTQGRTWYYNPTTGVWSLYSVQEITAITDSGEYAVSAGRGLMRCASSSRRWQNVGPELLDTAFTPNNVQFMQNMGPMTGAGVFMVDRNGVFYEYVAGSPGYIRRRTNLSSPATSFSAHGHGMTQIGWYRVDLSAVPLRQNLSTQTQVYAVPQQYPSNPPSVLVNFSPGFASVSPYYVQCLVKSGNVQDARLFSIDAGEFGYTDGAGFHAVPLFTGASACQAGWVGYVPGVGLVAAVNDRLYRINFPSDSAPFTDLGRMGDGSLSLLGPLITVGSKTYLLGSTLGTYGWQAAGIYRYDSSLWTDITSNLQVPLLLRMFGGT